MPPSPSSGTLSPPAPDTRASSRCTTCHLSPASPPPSFSAYKLNPKLKALFYPALGPDPNWAMIRLSRLKWPLIRLSRPNLPVIRLSRPKWSLIRLSRPKCPLIRLNPDLCPDYTALIIRCSDSNSDHCPDYKKTMIRPSGPNWSLSRLNLDQIWKNAQYLCFKFKSKLSNHNRKFLFVERKFRDFLYSPLFNCNYLSYNNTKSFIWLNIEGWSDFPGQYYLWSDFPDWEGLWSEFPDQKSSGQTVSRPWSRLNFIPSPRP